MSYEDDICDGIERSCDAFRAVKTLLSFPFWVGDSDG